MVASQLQRTVIGLAVLTAALIALTWTSPAQAGVSAGPRLDARGDLEIQTIIDVNGEREARGLPPLYADSTLGAVARERSQDMAINGYFSHYDSSGNPIYVQLLDAYNVAFFYAGENLAWNTYGDDITAGVAVETWIQSRHHAENMFSWAYNKAGIGVVSVNDKKVFTLILVGD